VLERWAVWQMANRQQQDAAVIEARGIAADGDGDGVRRQNFLPE